MATVTVNSEDYSSYTTVEEADLYLAADVSRAAAWEALDEDPDKGRALVTATRLLQRQRWRAGAPDPEADVAEVVQQATAILAADIVSRPGLGDSGSTTSNIKSVGGAGVPTVEFFAPVRGAPLPQAAFALLRDLLGLAPGSGADSPALDNTAYGSSNYQRSRFDRTDYGLIGDGQVPVEPWP